MANRILHIAGRDEPRLIVFIMIAAALMSGLMSDMGAVAVMLPAVVSLANSANIPLAMAHPVGVWFIVWRL